MQTSLAILSLKVEIKVVNSAFIK